jgi:hypothetical protein
MASAFWKQAAIRLGRVGVEQKQAETSFIAPPNGMAAHPWAAGTNGRRSAWRPARAGRSRFRTTTAWLAFPSRLALLE